MDLLRKIVLLFVLLLNFSVQAVPGYPTVKSGGGGIPLWQPLTGYSADEHVNYLDKLYRANMALTSDPVFNPANWTEVSDDLNREAAGTVTDNAIMRWDGTTGDDANDSLVLISDTGEVTGATRLVVDNVQIDGNTVDTTSGNLTLNAAGGDVVIDGNLTVNGTTTTVNSTTLDVDASKVNVNVDGNQAAADLNDAGIEVNMTDATNAGLAYDSTLTSRFKIGEVGGQAEVITSTFTQSLTNKEFGTSGSINADLFVDVVGTTKSSRPCPIMTEAQRDALTAVQGGCVFNSDSTSWNVYDGTAWVSAGGGGLDIWMPSTDYSTGDHVNESDKIYRALSDFTSGLTFNPANWAEVSDDLNREANGSVTDRAVVIWDGTTGDDVLGTGVLIDASDNITGINNLTYTGTITTPLTANRVTYTNASGEVTVTNDLQFDDTVDVLTLVGQANFDDVRLDNNVVQSTNGVLTLSGQAGGNDVLTTNEFGVNVASAQGALDVEQNGAGVLFRDTSGNPSYMALLNHTGTFSSTTSSDYRLLNTVAGNLQIERGNNGTDNILMDLSLNDVIWTLGTGEFAINRPFEMSHVATPLVAATTTSQIYPKSDREFYTQDEFSIERPIDDPIEADLLDDRDFEKIHAADLTGAWTLAAGTAAVNTTDVFSRNQSLDVTLAAQTLDLEQNFSCDQYDGRLVSFAVNVKSSAVVQICGEIGGVEESCTSSLGSDTWEQIATKFKAVSGSTCGVTVKTSGNVTDLVTVDDFDFTSDPLKYLEDASNVEPVRAAGNAGEAITANVTDIPFILTNGNTNWDGDSYTAPASGNYTFSGGVTQNVSNTAYLYAYIDGVQVGIIGGIRNAGTEKGFSGTFYLEIGQELSIRADQGFSVTNNPGVHNLSITGVAQRLNYTIVEDNAGLTVNGSGNGGGSVTSNVTDIDFTEVVDSGNRWSGTTYTVKHSQSIITLAGQMSFTTNARRFARLYVNGVLYKYIGPSTGNGSNDSLHPFNYTSSVGEFSPNDVLSIRSLSGGTLTNADHYITINELNVGSPRLYALPSSRQNRFNATIDSAGNIVNSNGQFIGTITKGGTGIYVITWVAGLFTVPPSVYGIVEGVDGRFWSANPQTTASGTTIVVKDDGGTSEDRAFTLNVTKLGPDYTPEGVWAGNVIPRRKCVISFEENDASGGGACATGSAVTRPLNTLRGDCGFVTLNSDQITIPDGAYEVDARGMTFRVNSSNLEWFLVGTGIEKRGMSSYGTASTNAARPNLLTHSFVITSPQTYELRQWCQTNTDANDMGIGSGTNLPNIYTEIILEKVGN